jgi:hypothetical protein
MDYRNTFIDVDVRIARLGWAGDGALFGPVPPLST